MKKIYLFLSLTLCGFFGSAQTILNGAFENWAAVNYDSLHFFQTSNQDHLPRYQNTTVSKSSPGQNSSFCVKMETKLLGTDTAFGYFINGNPNDLSGGIPYAQKPDSLKGYWKGSISAGDSAIIFVVFKEAGTPVSMDIFKITGTAAAFTPFSFAINIPTLANPDSVIVGAASSNAFVFNGIPGNSFFLDSLMFTGTGITQPANLNGDFELWSNSQYFSPANWEVNSGNYLRSTDKYQGNYALHLSNLNPNDPNYINGSYATNGHFINVSPWVVGGAPYTSLQDTVCGYYKFITNEQDTAIIQVLGKNNGTVVGYGERRFEAANTYTYFEVPLNCASAPDTLLIVIQSRFDTVFGPTSKFNQLLIDELHLKTQPLTTAITSNPFMNAELLVWPLPASDELNVLAYGVNDYSSELMLIDALGKVVLKGKLSQHKKIQLDGFEKGIYILKVTDGRKCYAKKVIIQ